MTNSKKQDKTTKPKIEISRRQTSGKKKPDLFAKFRNDEHPLDVIVQQPDNPTVDYPSIPDPTLDTYGTGYSKLFSNTDVAAVPDDGKVSLETSQSNFEVAVSPNKNFTKVSNSLVKQAIPDGLFRGQSKHTYDVLYQSTRGAINPKREVQLKKSDLVRLTGLEMKTIQRHLSFLRSVGLIMVDPKIGDHKGAIYRVKIPEEMILPYPTLPQTGIEQTGVAKSGTKSVPNPGTNYTTLGQGNPQENEGLTGIFNTSFKTIKNDDEAFAKFIDVFRRAVLETTGKNLTAADQDKLEELAELLALELRAAARRTGTVSNAPAFLTEVLRRQFFSARQNKTAGKSSAKTSAIKPDKVGKSGSETFEIKPLDKPGREAALEQLREFADESFLEDFKKWYTPEDWQWLTEKLKTKVSD